VTGGHAIGRSGGRLVAMLLTAAPAHRLTAQISWHVAAGARYTTPLVHDSIVSPFDVKLALAPELALTVGAQPGHGWAPQVLLDASTSNLVRHDPDGTTITLERVSTVSFAVGVSHTLPGGLRGSVAVGGLKYLPSEESGIFRQGSGAISPLGALSVAYGLPLGEPGRPRRWWLEVRYDIHAFTTPALDDEGFTSSQTVHRVALALGREFGHTP